MFGEVLEKHLTIRKVDKQGDSVPFGEVLGVCGKKLCQHVDGFWHLAPPSLSEMSPELVRDGL